MTRSPALCVTVRMSISQSNLKALALESQRGMHASSRISVHPNLLHWFLLSRNRRPLADGRTALDVLDVLALRKAPPFENVVWNDGALLVVVVVGVLDVVDAKVVETSNADNVEEEDAAGFGQEGDLDRVETEADGFTCAQDTTEDADIVGELLWRVGDGSNPVVDDVVPQLLDKVLAVFSRI